MKKYANEEFKGCIRKGKGGTWQGVHELGEAKKDLGSTRKRYNWRTDWEDGSHDEGVADQENVAPAEHPNALNDNS